MFKNILSGHCMSGHRTLYTCVQNFRPGALTVFEILGFKLKNKNNDKKNWRNGLLAISPMFVVQLVPNFR